MSRATKARDADMLATARALVAAGCPTLPDQYVPHKGEPAYHCGHCGVVRDSGPDDCQGCGDDRIEQTWPNLERVPDLRTDANALALLGVGGPYLVGCLAPHKSHNNDGYHVTAPGHETQRSDYLAHAVAKVLLLVNR